MIEGLNSACIAHHEKMAGKGFWEAKCKDNNIMFITQQLMLIVTEVAEATEALREGNHGEHKDSFEDEITDVMLRLMDLIGGLDIDIEAHLIRKSALNEMRPYLHGKEF